MQPTLSVKQSLYEHFARVGKAVSSPQRLEILDWLSQSEKTVERLAECIKQPIANTSAHLKALRQANLVDTRKEGKHVFYRLADDTVAEFWLALRKVGEARLAEIRETVRTFYQNPEGLSPLEQDELMARVESGEVVLLDVRVEDEYFAGHLPHAINVPMEQLEARLSELPRDKTIVAYCRGRYCITVFTAVELLRRHGYTAQRLEAGVLEWRASGHPVAMNA